MFMLPKDFCVKGIRTHVKKKKVFKCLPICQQNSNLAQATKEVIYAAA